MIFNISEFKIFVDHTGPPVDFEKSKLRESVENYCKEIEKLDNTTNENSFIRCSKNPDYRLADQYIKTNDEDGCTKRPSIKSIDKRNSKRSKSTSVIILNYYFILNKKITIILTSFNLNRFIH